jgi:hypothetical protein
VSDLPEELARYAPSPHHKDVEAVLGRHTAKRAIWVAPALALIFLLFRGPGGAVASLVGVAIVAGNFVLSGIVMSRSARISLSLYHAAALFGFFLRLGLIMVSMFVVAGVFEIDRLALGVSVVVSYLVLLSWEALSVAKGAEKELEWT